MALTNTLNLFNFNTNSDISNWYIIDDGVMGGRSNGKFSVNEKGNGVFEGNISLENNGGFSSLRYDCTKTEVKGFSEVVLKVKGDGNRYQFRIKEKSSDPHSYIYFFNTSSDWETVSIPLQDLYPSFRGRTLKRPHFSGQFIEEIGFLYGNKKEESFKLEIDLIELK